MAITLADFNKIWASTSPLTPYSFSEANYKQGWNFIGSTPPARQMWDFLQKNNDEKMQYLANTYLPAVVGAVVAFSGRTTPQGWLLCDGSAVSRTTYAALFAVIGTTYGAGNGSTTFNLPNLTDKFIQGSETVGTVKAAGLPNITGVVWINGGKSSTDNGAIKYTAKEGGGGTDNPNTGTGSFSFDASRSSSVYGKSTTVQPPALTMRYIIKY